MRRKPKRRPASKSSKTARKTSRSKALKASQAAGKRKSARGAGAKGRRKPVARGRAKRAAARAAKRSKTTRGPSPAARTDGAATARYARVQRETVIEPAHVEREPDEGTITVGEGNENEEFDETFTEEEEEYTTDDSDEEY